MQGTEGCGKKRGGNDSRKATTRGLEGTLCQTPNLITAIIPFSIKPCLTVLKTLHAVDKTTQKLDPGWEWWNSRGEDTDVKYGGREENAGKCGGWQM